MPSTRATLDAKIKVKQEDSALEKLLDLEKIHGSQRSTLSRRILGIREKPTSKVVAYVTPEELDSLKMLAKSVGMSVSLLIRVTMTQLAGGYQKPLEYPTDPRLMYSQPLATPED